MSDLRTNRIYDAIASLEHEAAFRRHVGGRSNLDHAKWLDLLREQAMGQYRQLSEAMPRLRSLSSEAERQYDRYVTRGERD
jgi:hypothetical protein